jgi:hypothetical protein
VAERSQMWLLRPNVGIILLAMILVWLFSEALVTRIPPKALTEGVTGTGTRAGTSSPVPFQCLPLTDKKRHARRRYSFPIPLPGGPFG